MRKFFGIFWQQAWRLRFLIIVYVMGAAALALWSHRSLTDLEFGFVGASLGFALCCAGAVCFDLIYDYYEARDGRKLSR